MSLLLIYIYIEREREYIYIDIYIYIYNTYTNAKTHYEFQITRIGVVFGSVRFGSVWVRTPSSKIVGFLSEI